MFTSAGWFMFGSSTELLRHFLSARLASEVQGSEMPVVEQLEEFRVSCDSLGLANCNGAVPVVIRFRVQGYIIGSFI